MEKQFAMADLTGGQLNAIVKKLRQQGGTDGVEKFLRGELSVAEPTRKWRYHAGIIYFTLVSDGTTGAEWITRLEKKGYHLSSYAKNVLLSDDFKPTKDVVYEIAVLTGGMWNDNDRITKNIRAEADKRNLEKPNAEAGCLIRDTFTDEEIEAMGLMWIVTMHEPIKDADGGPSLLGTDRSGGGGWLDAYYGRPDSEWGRANGFAFAVSQVSSSPSVTQE